MIACPQCAGENEEHYKFCLACGTELVGQQAKIRERPSSPSLNEERPKLPDLKARLQALRTGRDSLEEREATSKKRGTDASQNSIPGWTAPPAGASPIGSLSVGGSQDLKHSPSVDISAAAFKQSPVGKTAGQDVEAGPEGNLDAAASQPAVESEANDQFEVSPDGSIDQHEESEVTDGNGGDGSVGSLAGLPDDSESGSLPISEPGSISGSAGLASQQTELDTSASLDGDEADPMADLPADSEDGTSVSHLIASRSGAVSPAAVREAPPAAPSVGADIVGTDGQGSHYPPGVSTTPGEVADVKVSLDEDGLEVTRPAMDEIRLNFSDPPAPARASSEAPAMERASDSQSAEDPPVDDRPTVVSPMLVDETRPCHQCGTDQPLSFKFCGSCGARIGGEQSQAVAPVGAEQNDSIGELVLIHPDGSEGEHFDLLDGNLIIGRQHEAALFSNDPYLSPEHAEISHRDGWMTIRDLHSLNGVFIRLQGEIALEGGDYFRIGQQLLRFEDLRATLSQVQPNDDGTYVLGSPTSGLWGKLVRVLSDGAGLSEWTLTTPEVYIGRDRGTIVFPDDVFVSASHCRIRRENGVGRLSDLGSTNGTYVRIKEPTALASGDLVLLGQQLFRVDLH